jgi:NAD(P)-dependent dehydrogenase (short-subunit alcohol dehydrogenase family)
LTRTVVVTGGSKGIGWAIVEKFAFGGFNVVSGSRTVREDVPSEIESNIKQISIDVRDRAAHQQLVKEALGWTGQLDSYINNAGYSMWKSIAEIDEEFLNDILSTNLHSYFWGCQAAANTLSTGGSIINVSSLAAKRGTANNSAYVASKFGIAGLTQSMAKELGPKGIRVNAVCPVLVATEGLITALEDETSPAKGNPDKFLSEFAKTQTALGRLPTAEEVADLCLFLTSPEASAITGQSINVDCGVLPN